jgi:hypothetical protein
MGSPNWSKIPFEKMPEWKRQEILARSKKTVEVLEQPVILEKEEEEIQEAQLIPTSVCDKCDRIFTSPHGLKIHQSKHK